MKEKRARDAARGIKPRAIRAMVLGIPNVGKSTLMNRLVGKKIAQTGNKPGVTKGQQWLRLGNELELLDTPGIYGPDLAIYGLDFFARYYSGRISDRYGLSIEQEEKLAPELLMDITAKRGYKEDYDRGSELVVHDIRQGKLGRYTLDRCEEMEQKSDD